MKKVCEFPECEKPYKGRGYCQGHLRQLQTGRPLSVLRKYSEGAGFRNAEGYIELFKPEYPGSKKSGYILEHRYLMEQKLGRGLYRHENVHHKNGVRNDNRLENLELWVRPQPVGQRLEDLLVWVIENYRDEIEKRL